MTKKVIEKNKVYEFEYTKANGEKSTRKALMITESPNVLKALDFSDTELSIDYLSVVLKFMAYQQYREQFMANMFDFETWAEHTCGKAIPKELLKYRNFTVDNIDNIKDLSE